MTLENLKFLKGDMADKNWTICSFVFHYKEMEYIVLVKRFVGTEKKVNNYALVKLHFMKSDDLKDDLEVEANSNGLLIDTKALRHYFGIEYQKNLGDILQQFTKRLGSVIPTSVPDKILKIEKSAMVQSLSKSDSENPNKVYCTRVKRNPHGGQRSEFNSDKTRLLRETLFVHFRNHPEISFCYSLDIAKENDDVTILKNFANNNSI